MLHKDLLPAVFIAEFASPKRILHLWSLQSRQLLPVSLRRIKLSLRLCRLIKFNSRIRTFVQPSSSTAATPTHVQASREWRTRGQWSKRLPMLFICRVNRYWFLLPVLSDNIFRWKTFSTAFGIVRQNFLQMETKMPQKLLWQRIFFPNNVPYVFLSVLPLLLSAEWQRAPAWLRLIWQRCLRLSPPMLSSLNRRYNRHCAWPTIVLLIAWPSMEIWAPMICFSCLPMD